MHTPYPGDTMDPNMNHQRDDSSSDYQSPNLSITKRGLLKSTAAMGSLALLPSQSAVAESADGNTCSLEEEPMDTEIRSVDGTNVVYQYGQPVPSFETWRQNNDKRQYADLNGEWKFKFGKDGEKPQEIGIEEGWYEPDYDDSDWHNVEVPQPWDLYEAPGFDTYDPDYWGEGTPFRDGYGWYRKTFDLPGKECAEENECNVKWEERYVKLNFLGAYYSARVYLNGEFVGVHEGGHTPFSLDVSDHLTEGQNVIAVRVYRRPWAEDYTPEEGDDYVKVRDGEELPPGAPGWWPYAGLTRDVYLEVTDQVTVSKLLVDAASGQATLRAVLYNHGEDSAKRLVELDPGTETGGESVSEKVTIDSGETRVISKTIEIPDAEHWSTDSPTTYEASATLYQGVGKGQVKAPGKGSAHDQLSARYGMRTVATDGSQLTLNGNPIFLKGFNWHEETGENGRSMTKAEYDLQFQRMEESNANFMRNCVYNRHPYVYEYADENGLIVLDGIENQWVRTPEQEVQIDYGLSRALITMMVWNQYNRPSVGMWSMQNESTYWDEEIYTEWMTDMIDAARAVDNQDRPITWAFKANNPFKDPLLDQADVIGLNEYFGYFYGDFEDLGSTLDEVHEKYPETPIVITENGAWSGPEKRENNNEGWHVWNFHQNWKQLDGDQGRRDYVSGYTHWLLKDYKARSGLNRENMNGISPMGTMNFGDSDLTTYKLFEAIRKAYGGRPPHKWRDHRPLYE